MEEKKILITREMKQKIDKKIKPKIFAKGKPDFWFIALILVMAVFGIIMLFSASASAALSESGNSFVYLSKQLKATVIGIILCILVSLLDYRIYNGKLIRFVCIIAMFISPVIVHFFGYESNHAKRWINIGGFSLQLSEFVKIFLIIFMSSYFTKITDEKKIDNPIESLVKPVIYLIIPAFLIYKFENHLSSAIVLTFITITIAFVSGIKWKYILSSGGIGLLLSAYIIKEKFLSGDAGFRSTRIKTFLDPWSDPTDKGYQITQSLLAVGSGGLFGKGIGQSIQKRNYLPEAQNDFIFAIVVEEMGLIGAFMLILGFFLLVFCSWKIATRSKDIFGKLIASGIAAFYTIQIFVNIAVAIGLVPVTGMGLPFFSSGGTSIMVTYITVGLLISISRINNMTDDVYAEVSKKGESNE